MRRAAAALAVALATAGAAEAQAPAATATLRIEGAFAKPRELRAQDLAACAARSVEIVPADKGAATPGRSRRYAGCLLRDLVAAAEPVERRPRDLRRSYLVATASDGYQVVLSWAELFLTPIGDTVVVAHARDGSTLDASEGPLALVSAADRGAARHVKMLVSIALRSVPDETPR